MSAGPHLFLLQMAGRPGSGKSSLARMIGHATGAVVLDKDVLKTALLNAGLEESLAGGAAYECFFDLADHLLGQGLSVILDSPSFFETIPAKGADIAARRFARYHFVECVCPEDTRARRLGGRSRLRSQPHDPAVALEQTTAAPGEPFLRVDTAQPIDRCLQLVLEYLQ